MTHEETVFWEIADQYALGNYGYSVVGLDSDGASQSHTLRLKRMGAPDLEMRRFTVFVDQLRNAVSSGILPEGLRRGFADELK